ncbi:MAG: hypothetical protein ABR548_04585 [Actinomycetota bacterium]
MRILAVTGDANLLTAITSMMLDWEIESIVSADEVTTESSESDVVLVDTGTTKKGLATAVAVWNRGVKAPCLVIGDVQAPDEAHVRVIVRPFGLRDLAQAVQETAESDLGEPEMPKGWTPVGAKHEDVMDVPGGEPVPEEMEPPEASVEEADEPATQAPVSPEPAPPAREPEVAAPTVTYDAVQAALAPQGAAVIAASTEEPQMPPAAAEEAPAASWAVEPAATETARPPGDRTQTRPDGLRRFLRRKPERQAPSNEAPADPMMARLRDALTAGRDLEKLLADLPVLAKPRVMAHAFLAEVVEMFGPQVAAVFAPGLDGSFSVIAAHGLSSVEAGMRVPASQPLFMQLATGLEAVLIAPVDLAQGLVAGIGGARTEALMAAPLEVDGSCQAIIIVGRQELSEFDLDLLAEQAEEAAPGLAVAHMFERLRCL